MSEPPEAPGLAHGKGCRMNETMGIQACMRLNAKLTYQQAKMRLLLNRLWPWIESVNHLHLKGEEVLYASEVWDALHGPEDPDSSSPGDTARTIQSLQRNLDYAHLKSGRILGAELLDRRNAQDRQWGGPAHDDCHDRHDWLGYVIKQLNEAENALDHPQEHTSNLEIYEDRMLDVGALAVAAIQSSRRKRGA